MAEVFVVLWDLRGVDNETGPVGVSIAPNSPEIRRQTGAAGTAGTVNLPPEIKKSRVCIG